MPHLLVHDGTTYTPDGATTIPAHDADRINAGTSREEVARFIEDRPDHAFAYVKDRTITTWMGDHLGTIRYMDRVTRDAFGNHRQHVVVTAINGRQYWGWYYVDAGSYVRLHAYKG